VFVTFIDDSNYSLRYKEGKNGLYEKLYKVFSPYFEEWLFRVITYNGNQGVNYAWNIAKSSTKQYICILNDDCLIPPQDIWTCLESMRKNLDYWIVCPMTERLDSSWKIIISDETPENYIGNIKLWNISGRCFFMPSVVVPFVFPIDTRIKLWYGDDWLFHSVRELGMDIVYLKKAKCYHYVSQTVANKKFQFVLGMDWVRWKRICQEKWRNFENRALPRLPKKKHGVKKEKISSENRETPKQPDGKTKPKTKSSAGQKRKWRSNPTTKRKASSYK